MTSGGLRRDFLWAALGLLAVLAWDASGADLVVTRWFGGAEGFAWREQWFAADVLHEGGQWLGRALFVALLVNVFRPLPVVGAMPRRERVLWCAVTLVCVLLIALLKHASRVSCPWSLAEFGGKAWQISHWSAAAWWGGGDGGPGRCFPSGHASAAFGFFSGWFALRRRAPRCARAWLLGVWALGLLFGLTQLARGAHHLSHTLWTAWLCWTTSLLLWRQRRSRCPAAAQTELLEAA